MWWDAFDILLQANFWAATIRIATPLIFGVLGALICERAGVLNLGIEGIFVAGAMAGWLAVYLGAAEVTEAFGINKSFLILFMVIIGGLGSIFGSFAGAGFLVLLPVLLKNLLVGALGWPTDLAAHIELMIVGALIIFFLIVEPHGLARLWQLVKEKLRLWPFPH